MKQILSKLLIVLSICVVHCTYLSAQNTITILNEKEGKIESIIKKKWKKEKSLPPMDKVTHLKIEGVMNKIDKNIIKTLFPSVTSLDIEGLSGVREVKTSELGLSNLKVLYLPTTCTSFSVNWSTAQEKQEAPHIKKLYGYENLKYIYCGNNSIPFVQAKSANDKNISPEDIGWDMSTLEKSTGSSMNINLLVSSEKYMKAKDEPRSKKIFRPLLHYNITTKETTVYGWDLHFRVKDLSKINYADIIDNSSRKYPMVSEDNVSLPSTLKSLSARLFGGSVRRLEFGDSQITKIPSSCFASCLNLRALILNENVEIIEEHAFSRTAIEKITIPQSVKRIWLSAFTDCRNLKEINMMATTPPSIILGPTNPSGIISALKNVVIRIPKGSYDAYIKDTNWSRLNIVEDGVEDKLELTITAPGTLASQIPFKSMSAIKSLTISGVLYDTDFEIFKKMLSLSYIDISNVYIIESPESLNKRIGKSKADKATAMLLRAAVEESYNKGQASAFDLASVAGYEQSMLSVETTEEAEKNYIPESAFARIESLREIRLPKVTSIDRWAFSGCVNLRTVEMPSTVMYIERYVFAGCSSLVGLKMPTALKAMGKNVFNGCKSIKTLDFSGCDSLSKINMDSFDRYGIYDNGVQYERYSGEIILPENIQEINGYTAERILKIGKNLTYIKNASKCTIHFSSQTPPKSDRIENCTIYVPKGSESVYYMAFGDKNAYIGE